MFVSILSSCLEKKMVYNKYREVNIIFLVLFYFWIYYPINFLFIRSH